MSRQIFVAWDRLDPLGTELGVLSDAFDKEAMVAFDGPGSGTFLINRHSSQAPWTRTGTYVKVHLESTANPAVHGFFVEEGYDVVVSAQEEGGEDFKRGGRGGLVYLERAIVDHIQRTANAFSIDADAAELVWTDKKVGRILKDLIEEAEARSPDPLAFLTYSWTASVDSNGDPWDTVEDEFRIPIGLDLLAAIEILKGQGLSVAMTPELELLAYQDFVGTLRSITFAKGVNIREAANRDIHASIAKSRLLVQGTRKSGAIIYKTVVDTTADDDIGPHEGFMRYSKNATVNRLEKAGRRQLASMKRQSDGVSTIGVTVGDGTAGPRGTGAGHYVPFTDYAPGDRVTIDVPGEFDALVKPVDAVTLQDTEAGEYDPLITFDAPNFNPSFGETAPGGGKDFGGDDQVGGGGAATPVAPTTIEIVSGACASLAPRSWLRRGPDGFEGVLGGLIMLYVGSHVSANSAWSVSACPIGGGSWTGYEDRESWWEFTAPADDPRYLGLYVTIDATGAWTSGETHGYHVGITAGSIAEGRYGHHTALGSGIIGGTMTVYVPRSHIAWGAVNSLVLAPDWECARSFFTCNAAAYFGKPLDDGRGGSGGYYDILPQTVCPVRFANGSVGLSGEVAGFGPIDGVNRSFKLIDWDGTGLPEHTINGLAQPVAGVSFNRTTGVATLSEAPTGPDANGDGAAVVLWSYTTGLITGSLTMTPDPVAVTVLVPAVAVPPPIYLLPAPVGVVVSVPIPFVDLA